MPTRTVTRALDFDYIESTGCWEIISHKPNKNGRISLRYAGLQIRAYRAVYEAFYGEIPEEMCVCHSCDNPICINPEHLFLGTNRENAQDRTAKDRQAKGEVNGSSKYTEAMVREIRDKDLHIHECRDRWGMHKDTVYAIKNRKTWKHIQ